MQNRYIQPMKYIKLFEHSYSIYDLITMPMWEATELLIEQCKKVNPDMDLVRDLFEYAVLDVNQQDKDGYTALMWASRMGRTEIVKGLLERPEIRVNLQDSVGETALIYASWNKHTEIVKLLLERPEIDVNVQNRWGITALILALEEGYTEIVNLIQSHPNFNPDL